MGSFIHKFKGRYITSATILYCIIGAITILITSNWNPIVLGWQVLSIILFYFGLIVGLKLKISSCFYLIFIYQIIMSTILHIYFVYIENNVLGYSVDTALYFEIASHTYDLSINDTIKALQHHFKDISDYGYPFFLKYVYSLGGNHLNTFRILLFLNCIFQTFACHFIYKICKILDINTINIKWIILMWGMNSASIYLNVSGLKEPLFMLLCTAAIYYVYKIKASKSFVSHIVFALLVLNIWFFRYYISLFLIIIYIGYILIHKIWNKLFALICLISMVLCIGLTDALINFFPEIYYAIMNSADVLPSSPIVRTIYYILAFLGPIPKFYSEITLQDPLIVMLSIEKFSFSIFALIGAYTFIKNKNVKYFPLIAIILFNTLLLIVSAHLIEYRYSYIILPLSFILMIESASIKYQKFAYLYLIISSAIVFAFNLKLYV